MVFGRKRMKIENGKVGTFNSLWELDGVRTGCDQHGEDPLQLNSLWN